MKEKFRQMWTDIDRVDLVNFSNFNRENFQPEKSSYWAIIILFIIFSLLLFMGIYPLITFLCATICNILCLITESKYGKTKSYTDFQLYSGTYVHTLGIISLLGAFKFTYMYYQPSLWVLFLWLLAYAILSFIPIFILYFLIRNGRFSRKKRSKKNVTVYAMVGAAVGVGIGRILVRLLPGDQIITLMVLLLLLLTVCGMLGTMNYLKYYIIKEYGFDVNQGEDEGRQ